MNLAPTLPDADPREPLTIAVTGHRAHRISANANAALQNHLHDILKFINTTLAPQSERLVYSAVAEGSDRLIAHAGLANGWKLHVILPFLQSDYETDFKTEPSKTEYRQLLAKATTVTELTHPKEPGNNAGYIAVGDALLARADLLIAIWDGEPSRGPGGTADVVNSATKGGIPVLWMRPEPDTAIQIIAPASADIATQPAPDNWANWLAEHLKVSLSAT